jgi:hypothetical protein
MYFKFPVSLVSKTRIFNNINYYYFQRTSINLVWHSNHGWWEAWLRALPRLLQIFSEIRHFIKIVLKIFFITNMIITENVSWGGFYITLEICALRSSFLHKFTIIWHHAFAPCAQLIALSSRFGWAQRFTPYAQLRSITHYYKADLLKN